MRYRLEILDNDEIVVHNVETGLILGSVIPHFVDHPYDPNRRNIPACTVFNHAGDQIALISGITVPVPLTTPAVAVANHEHHNGYPGLTRHAAEPCRPNRVETALGVLLADTCAVIARGVIECRSGGLEGETKERYANLIGGLYAIWYASRFGSFDDGDRSRTTCTSPTQRRPARGCPLHRPPSIMA